MNINWKKLSSHNNFKINWLGKYRKKSWNMEDIYLHKNFELGWIRKIYSINEEKIFF